MDTFIKTWEDEPDANEKAWGFIHDVMHHLLSNKKKKYPEISPQQTTILEIFELLHNEGFNLNCNITNALHYDGASGCDWCSYYHARKMYCRKCGKT